MEQNFCPVVDEVAKPTSIGLDELVRTIESFSTGIANPVTAAVEQLLTGRVQLSFATIPTILPYVRDGRWTFLP